MTELSWRNSGQIVLSTLVLVTMKTKIAVLIMVLVTAFGNGCATSGHAKVLRADAQRVALAKVPGGTVKEAELEKEHGRLIWSFDIARPGSTTITEVHVDANRSEE